jgi:prepilin-type N-terminal cleavage/methylation domain-containing protein
MLWYNRIKTSLKTSPVSLRSSCYETGFKVQSVGFTLIELLVTTSLSLILAGGALAAYNNFNSQQGFIQTSKNVIADFERTRSKSLAGEKPATCASLLGHRIRGSASSSIYFLSIRCGGASPEVEIEQKNLPSGYTFADTFDLLFPPHPSPLSTTDQTINIVKTGDSRVYRLIIGTNGVIQDVGLVSP